MHFSLCVLAVSSFETAVVVVIFVHFSFTDVSVIGKVVLSDSECEKVESKTFSLSPESAKHFFWLKVRRHEN